MVQQMSAFIANMITVIFVGTFALGYMVGLERGKRGREGKKYLCGACHAVAQLELEK